MSKDVFVLLYNRYEDTCVMGVFTTLERAEAVRSNDESNYWNYEIVAAKLDVL